MTSYIGNDCCASILTYANEPNVLLVSKNFRACTYLAMKCIWLDGRKLVEDVYSSLPGNPVMYAYLYDREEKLRNSLMTRMQTIVPSEQGLPNDEKIVHCFRNLLKSQSQAVRETTLPSARTAFEKIQGRYGLSPHFNRFIENERLIERANDEMDRNLLGFGKRISEVSINALTGLKNMEAHQIRDFIANRVNRAHIQTVIPRLNTNGDPASPWTAFPKEICSFNITELSITTSGYIDLPIEFGTFSTLTKLSIIWSPLQTVPLPICRLTQLRSLVLARNRINHLPEQLTALRQLKSLSLTGNQLTHIPPFIGILSSLKDLSFGENQISELPAALSTLVNLEYLHVAGNLLTCIPSWISELPLLCSFGMQNNQITEFPAFLGNPSFEPLLRGTGYYEGFGGPFNGLNLRDNPIREVRTLAYQLVPLDWMNLNQVDVIEVSFTEWFLHSFTISQVQWGGDDSLACLLCGIPNALIWTINQITLNIVEPFARLVRGWLGYPATVRL